MITNFAGLVLLLISAVILPSQAQPVPSAGQPFGVLLPDSPIIFKGGERQLKLEFLFSIPENYFLYRSRTTIVWQELAGATVKETLAPQGRVKHDHFFNRPEEIWEHEAVITVALEWQDVPQKTIQVSGIVRLQGCSSELCYKPTRVPFAIIIEPATVSQAQTEDHVPKMADNAPVVAKIPLTFLQNIWQKGGLWIFFVAWLGGLLTDLTPCVWPLIPLTLAVIGVKERTHPWANLGHTCMLCLGISLTNAVLGMLAAGLGKQIGFILQNPLVLILITLFFLAMAAEMLGLWNLTLPSSWLTAMSRWKPTGAWGNFVAGATLGVLAAPCVGPVMVPLLVVVAQGASVLKGGLLLLSYGIGVSSIFFVCGLSGRFLHQRFKNSAFTKWVKIFLGITLVALAIGYATIVYRIYVPPKPAASIIRWEYSMAAGKILSQELHRPVLVDFFAQWCVPCLEIEKTLFAHPEVSEMINREFVAVHLDCTVDNEECDQATAEYNVIGWPTLLFLDCQGQVLADSALVGVVPTPVEMKNHLAGVQQLFLAACPTP